MYQRFLVLLFLILPVGCDSPTADFAAAPVKQVTVGRSVFSVRQIGDRAQAIRVNTEYAPNWSHTYIRFAKAIEQATACTVKPRSMEGDQALMEARLNCPYPTRANPGRQSESLDCYVWQDSAHFDCDVNIPRATPGGP